MLVFHVITFSEILTEIAENPETEIYNIDGTLEISCSDKYYGQLEILKEFCNHSGCFFKADTVSYYNCKIEYINRLYTPTGKTLCGISFDMSYDSKENLGESAIKELYPYGKQISIRYEEYLKYSSEFKYFGYSILLDRDGQIILYHPGE